MNWSEAEPALSPEQPRKERGEGEPTRTLDQQISVLLHSKGIEAPPVHIHIALITHSTKKDAEDLQEKIMNADIFIPELVGLPSNGRQVLNDLSQGTITPRQAARRLTGGWVGFLLLDSFQKTLLKLIYKSKKEIGNTDLPEGHPLSREAHAWFGMIDQTLNGGALPFGKAALRVARAAEEFGGVNAKRESYILRKLPSAIATLIETNKSLQHQNHQKPLKVLLYLGAGHNEIPKALKEQGNEVTSNLSKVSRYPDYTLEAIKKAQFGERLTQEDGQKMLLQGMFERLYRSSDKRKDALFAPLRKMMDGHTNATTFAAYIDWHIPRQRRRNI